LGSDLAGGGEGAVDAVGVSEDAEVFFGAVVVERAVGGFEGHEAGGAEAGG